jgi:hypothetical protein
MLIFTLQLFNDAKIQENFHLTKFFRINYAILRISLTIFYGRTTENPIECGNRYKKT